LITLMTAPPLDDYSAFALPRILERFPEWKDCLHFRAARPSGLHFVVIEIDAPLQSVEQGLYVGTEDAELTVGFHTYHCHFTDWNDAKDRATLEAGLDFASNLLSEKVGVATNYRDDQWAGGTWIDLPHPGPLPLVAQNATRITLRSWRGTFDRDELV